MLLLIIQLPSLSMSSNPSLCKNISKRVTAYLPTLIRIMPELRFQPAIDNIAMQLFCEYNKIHTVHIIRSYSIPIKCTSRMAANNWSYVMISQRQGFAFAGNWLETCIACHISKRPCFSTINSIFYLSPINISSLLKTIPSFLFFLSPINISSLLKTTLSFLFHHISIFPEIPLLYSTYFTITIPFYIKITSTMLSYFQHLSSAYLL